jgi:hypothetical protein
MKGIPPTPLTLEIARRIIWFEPPEQALAEPVRFMAYAMTYARHEDMQVIRRYVCDEDIREALDQAPPGIIDARSWAYWNSKVGRYPAPPLPVRQFGAAIDEDRRLSPRTVNTGDLNFTPKSDLDSQRRLARENWLQMRDGEASKLDPEQTRRKAREDWRNKYPK